MDLPLKINFYIKRSLNFIVINHIVLLKKIILLFFINSCITPIFLILQLCIFVINHENAQLDIIKENTQLF